jgi:hypothetical protein
MDFKIFQNMAENRSKKKKKKKKTMATAQAYRRRRKMSQEAYSIRRGSQRSQLLLNPEVLARNFFATLRSLEM